MRKTIQYKKSDRVGRWLHEKIYLRGWHVVSEEETGSYSAGKGFLLALFFLPLAIFGFGKYIKVTYEKD